MKIYASKIDLTDFDYYVGKDLWVRVTSASTTCWVKLLSKGKDSRSVYYKCLAIFDGMLDVDGRIHLTSSALAEFYDHIYIMWTDNSYVAQPIDILEEDEIIERI